MGMSAETVENKRGRPSGYTPEIATEICARIATGSESIRAICADDAMPSTSMVFRWILEKPDFREQYARAREEQTEVYAQDMLDIARNCPADKEAINKARLEIDTMKWIASKLKPKKYGDAMTLKGDKDNPLELGLATSLDIALRKRNELPIIDVQPVQDAHTLNELPPLVSISPDPSDA